MDSDAIVDVKFLDYTINDMLAVMQQTLSWDPEAKPMVFNQVRQSHFTLQLTLCTGISSSSYALLAVPFVIILSGRSVLVVSNDQESWIRDVP
jgi:hypothetical protein